MFHFLAIGARVLCWREGEEEEEKKKRISVVVHLVKTSVSSFLLFWYRTKMKNELLRPTKDGWKTPDKTFPRLYRHSK
jgi:hypothetical protein